MPYLIQSETSNYIPIVQTDEPFSLSFLLDIYPSVNSSQARWFKWRLTLPDTLTGAVDGVNDTFTFTQTPAIIYRNGTEETELGSFDGDDFTFDTPPDLGDTVTGRIVIPVKEVVFKDDEHDFTGVVDVELARHSDRSIIDRDSQIRLEKGEKISGVWVYETVLDTGQLKRSDYTLSRQGIGKADSFTLSASSILQTRLDTTPLQTVSVYDPLKVTVQDSDFLQIADIDGVADPVVIVPISGLTLQSLLDYFGGQCGFDAVITNIPDYALERIDFPPGQPFWNTISGEIGVFEPIVEIVGNTLYLRDGTSDIVADSSAARVITVSNAERLGDSKEIQRFKGTLLTYQTKAKNWDYAQDRVTYHLDPPDGLADIVTNTEIVTRYYYRNSFPNVPVDQKVIRTQATSTINTFTRFHRVSEQFTYDDNGLLSRREKRIEARVPMGTGFPSLAGSTGYYYDHSAITFSSTASIFEYRFQMVESELETCSYLADPYEAESVYMAYREVNKTGIIMTDGDNQQLGEDYADSLMQAYQRGDLVEGMTGSWGNISNYREWQTPLQNRMARIRVSNTDYLHSQRPEDHFDDRVGDIGIKTIQKATRDQYVYTGADPTAKRILTLNGGEAPIGVLVPLAERYNRRQFHPSNVAFTVPGLDTTLTKGSIVAPQDREGNALGTYRITGRSLEGRGGQYRTIITCQEIGAYTYTSDYWQGSSSVTLFSGQSKTITLDIPCFDGYELSGSVVPDVTVEIRRGTVGAYQDAETLTYDESPYAGTTQTFQLRFTVGTITTPIKRKFVLTSAPVSTTLYLTNDLGDQLTNDSGDALIS
jgi:hypothetical protein